MLDLNILGFYLRVARHARTTFAGKTTMRFWGGLTTGLGNLVREGEGARAAVGGDGERALTKSRGAAPESRDEAALQRRCHGAGKLEGDRRRSRRERCGRTVAARTKARAGADRIQRASEGQTASYLRRLTAGERVGAAGRRRRR